METSATNVTMRSTTLSFILAVTTLSGCAHGTQLSAAGCTQSAPKGVTTFDQGSERDVNKPASLTVRLTEGTRRNTALKDAAISLHGDTNVVILSDPLRSAMTDSLGGVHWDSISAGRYLLVVRRLGYESLRRVLSLRTGYADTVKIQLRTDPQC
ncbi:MAG: hypothetical protein ABJC26_11335 [Gemmatimonadaceae bacterium]